MTCKKPNVGGQAVIEGVMMRGADKVAVAVRKPDGGNRSRCKARQQHPRQIPNFEKTAASRRYCVV